MKSREQQQKQKQQPDANPGILATSMERLTRELVELAGAQVQRLADAATSRLTGVAGRVGETAQSATQTAAHTAAHTAATLPKAGGQIVGKGAKTLTEGAKKAAGGGGEERKRAKAGPKVTNIIETIDIGLPPRICYNHWTQYERFSEFMKGVQGVQRVDDVTSDWKLKIGPSSRGWQATIQEQVPDQRIEWTSEGAQGSTRGVVTFHELAPNLTRIVVAVEYYPAGFFEKTANLWRAQGRRLRLDVKHFRRHVTLEAEEVPEGWRGEIRDGEVVRTHEEAMEEEQRREPRAAREEEEDEEDEEYEEDEDEDEEDEEDEDEEEEEERERR